MTCNFLRKNYVRSQLPYVENIYYVRPQLPYVENIYAMLIRCYFDCICWYFFFIMLIFIHNMLMFGWNHQIIRYVVYWCVAHTTGMCSWYICMTNRTYIKKVHRDLTASIYVPRKTFLHILQTSGKSQIYFYFYLCSYQKESSLKGNDNENQSTDSTGKLLASLFGILVFANTAYKFHIWKKSTF